MKKFALLVVLFAAVAASAFGDEITFSFILGQSHSVEEADALHHRKRKVASPTGTATSDPTG